jgi:CRP-like cAMP-binding protein
VQTPAGTEIGLPLTKAELAGMIGVQRETATRILRGFRSLGWLETDRQRITLLREDRLRQRSEG